MKSVSVHILMPFFLFLQFGAIGSASGQGQIWSIQDCIDTAKVYNVGLLINEHGIELNRQRHKEAKANLIPKLNVMADYKYFANLPYQLMPLSVFGGPDGQFKEAQFGVPHNINGSVQFATPIYNPNIYSAIRTTRIREEMSRIQYEETEEKLYYEITTLYYNAQILLNQSTFIDSNISNATRLLKNVKLLREQMLAIGTDVEKIQLQLSQLETQKDNISSRYEQVINALKFSIGIPVERVLHIDYNIQIQKETQYTGVSTTEYRLAETKQQLLFSELKKLRTTRIPSVTLIGTYGTTGFGYDNKPNDFLNFYPISFAGIQLSYPLFAGTVTYRKIAQKKIELETNKLQLKLISDKNEMNITNAYNKKNVSRKSVVNTIEQMNLAQKLYDQTVLQQKLGTASLTDVLLADNALRTAQQSYLTAVVEYLKADLELKRITGNIFK